MFRSHSTNFNSQGKIATRTQSSGSFSNEPALAILDLSHKNINDFPTPNPLVKCLNASSNSLTSLSSQMVNALLSYHRLTELNLSDNLLVEFPNELNKLEHLETLTLLYNRIQYFNINIPTLKNLDLSQNRLTSMPCLPPNLESLSFDFNLLHGLNFSHCTLQKLTLVLTELEYINPDVSFPNLVHLDLSRNKLALVPDLHKLAPKLEFLDLSDNFLNEMPMPPVSIREYLIKSNLILELPKNLSSLINLKNLIVSNNHIEFIPVLPPSIESFVFSNNQVRATTPCKTPKLKRLYIRNNKLSSYPQYDKLNIREYSGGFNLFTDFKPLFYHETITRIDFTHNMIKEIPSFVFKIPGLSILDLSHNKIRKISNEIGRLKRLTSLNLSENPIQNLPALPRSLESIYVGYCHLIDLPDMKNNVFLTSFCAPGNNLDKIPNAPNLKTIVLSKNRFVEFPEMLPRSIASLDFSFNFIQKIPSQIKYYNLEELDLSFNSILEFTDDFELPNLKFFKIGSNPIPRTVCSPEKFKGLEICDITNTGIIFETEPIIRQLFVSKLLPQYKTRHVKQTTSLPWVGYSEMKGVRPEMEDAITVSALLNGDVDLYALCDGHGGSKTSAFSSLFLYDDISRPGLKLSKKDVYSSVKRLNRALRIRMFPDGSTMGFALFNGSKIVTAHIGDTRILVTSKDGKVSFATVDHKSTDRSEFERIHLTGGRVSSNRIHGILAPGRSLGDFVVPGNSDEPEVRTYRVLPNDRWLIIACDGVFDVLSNEKIAEFAKSATTAADLAYDLRNLAFTLNSTDNISVIVVDIARRTVPSGVEHINDDDDDDVLPTIPITSSFDEIDFKNILSSSFPSFGSDTFKPDSPSPLSPSSNHFSNDYSTSHFLSSPKRNAGLCNEDEDDEKNYSEHSHRMSSSQSMPSFTAPNSQPPLQVNNTKCLSKPPNLPVPQTQNPYNLKVSNAMKNRSPKAPAASVLNDKGLYTMSSFIDTDNEDNDDDDDV